MASLKTVRQRVGAVASRFAAQQHEGKERDQQRSATAPWRAWYKTARWQTLKLFVHVRDMYVCQRTGILCIGKYPADNSPVANHKQPHRGDPELFWDPDNIETIAKSVHDSDVQREEHGEIKGVWY